jgi:hypothetical protein
MEMRWNCHGRVRMCKLALYGVVKKGLLCSVREWMRRFFGLLQIGQLPFSCCDGVWSEFSLWWCSPCSSLWTGTWTHWGRSFETLRSSVWIPWHSTWTHYGRSVETVRSTVLTPWHSTCESSLLSLALQWPLLPSSRLIVVGHIQTGIIKPTLTEYCWPLTVHGGSWV